VLSVVADFMIVVTIMKYCNRKKANFDEEVRNLHEQGLRIEVLQDMILEIPWAQDGQQEQPSVYLDPNNKLADWQGLPLEFVAGLLSECKPRKVSAHMTGCLGCSDDIEEHFVSTHQPTASGKSGKFGQSWTFEIFD
jgi:hypothetical protein